MDVYFSELWIQHSRYVDCSLLLTTLHTTIENSICLIIGCKQLKKILVRYFSDRCSKIESTISFFFLLDVELISSVVSFWLLYNGCITLITWAYSVILAILKRHFFKINFPPNQLKTSDMPEWNSCFLSCINAFYILALKIENKIYNFITWFIPSSDWTTIYPFWIFNNSSAPGV